MSDIINLGRSAKNIKASPAFAPISGVRVVGMKDSDGSALNGFAGDETGRVIETEIPFAASQQEANNIAADILAQILGYAYRPYKADGAILDPAAELGDAVSVDEVYSVINSVDTTFSSLMSASVAARESGVIEHEYPYESKLSRETRRKISGVETRFTIELGRITSSISETYETKADAIITREQLDSKIEQTATSITSTVASSQSKYELPIGLTISAFGYGVPSNATAGNYRNQYYLDQSAGLYYRSNGSVWSVQNPGNPLPLITTTLESKIQQTADSISLQIKGQYANEWEIGSGISSDFFYNPGDIVKVTSGNDIAFYRCVFKNNSTAYNKPGTSAQWTTYWEAVEAPSIESLIDLSLDGITLSYDVDEVGSNNNSAYIKLTKGNVSIGGLVRMSNVTVDHISADSITAGTLDAGDIAVNGQFTVKRSENNQLINCGWLGGGVAKIPDYQNVYADAVALRSGSEVAYIATSDGPVQDNVKSGSAMIRNRDAVVYCNASFFQNQSGAGSFTDVHPYCAMETSGGDHYIAVTYNAIRASEQITVVSDRREKTGIDYDMSRYEKLFRELKPCSYLRKNAEGKHIGFIAQDVDESLTRNGFDNSAVIGRHDGMDEAPMLSLAYGEFTALNTYMIQQVMKRVDALQKKLEGNQYGQSN